MKTKQLLKRIKVVPILLVVILVSSCSSSVKGGEEDDNKGTLGINCLTQSGLEIISKATFELPSEIIPSANDFSVNIKGSYIDPETTVRYDYDESYSKVSIYNEDLPQIPAGDGYIATVCYGDSLAEGENKPYFIGKTEEFEIVARKKIEQNISAKLGNSVFNFATEEWFDRYYTTASFVVRTSTGGEYYFDKGVSDKLIFLKASTTLTIEGSAVKTNGTSVTFPEMTIGVTKATTLSRILVDMADASSANIVISFNDKFTEAPAQIIEINPEL